MGVDVKNEINDLADEIEHEIKTFGNARGHWRNLARNPAKIPAEEKLPHIAPCRLRQTRKNKGRDTKPVISRGGKWTNVIFSFLFPAIWMEGGERENAVREIEEGRRAAASRHASVQRRAAPDENKKALAVPLPVHLLPMSPVCTKAGEGNSLEEHVIARAVGPWQSKVFHPGAKRR
jgi:hypothetical protein